MERDRVFLILILIVGGIMTYVYFLNPPSTGYKPTDESTSPPTSEPRRYVSLSTDVRYQGGYWFRGENDLPFYDATFLVHVSNNGNMIARDTAIRCYINESLFESTSVDIGDLTYYTDTIEDIHLQYDQIITVMVQASFQDQTQTDSVILKAEFPRYQTEDVQLFITPNDPTIVSLRNQIVRNKLVHWTALRNWVGSNIEYEYDSVQFGESEYWLLSRETLSLEKGDCEDQAILLCSLLRADGWDSDEVYVILGKVGDVGHAWVSLKIVSFLGKELWINVEPTVGGFLETQFADLDSIIKEIMGQTTRAYKFNDASFETIG